MANIGRINDLPIVRESDLGLFLDGGQLGQILLPRSVAPDSWQPGGSVKVFVYVDSEERLVATTAAPLAVVGEFSWLQVVSVTDVGAFLDWGMPKDLLLPYSEQKFEPEVGRRVMVGVFLDEKTQRPVASTRIDDFLEDEAEGFVTGQEVELLIADSTELGYKAIVNHTHWGVLYSNELFQSLEKGQRITGYIKKVRDDKKIDLTLSQPGYKKISSISEQIMSTLKQNDGYVMITDKSPPEAIYAVFKVSKKVYKKAVGSLYKQRRIIIEKHGIRLVEAGSAED